MLFFILLLLLLLAGDVVVGIVVFRGRVGPASLLEEFSGGLHLSSTKSLWECFRRPAGCSAGRCGFGYGIKTKLGASS